ncbi:toll/interleukin-1 receptor domain-containing protein [Streptomyces anthocyanicus]|uniref:toll/interleukin-1 receptor domain-containing protein n=2 Tax=Streptomyces TaxID=1883 RepID=UPI003668412F
MRTDSRTAGGCLSGRGEGVGSPLCCRGSTALKIFISHGGEGTDACVDEALTLLVPRLKAQGYEVFTDVDDLRGGDSWNEVLYEEMYLCDAAIVLLGPETIATSNWVRLESDVLMGRHMVRSLRTVLPGILGTEDTATARRRGYGALLKLQAVLCRRKLRPLPGDGGVAQFTEWVVAEFAPVNGAVGDRPFHDWVKRISSFLRTSRECNPDTLSHAAELLQCSRSELVHVRAKVGSELFLAHLMIKAAIAAVDRDVAALLPQAVAALRPGLAGSQLKQLADEILPSWVNPDTALCFAQDMASETAERRPVVLFHAYDEWTAHQHVRRAVHNKPDSYSLGELPAFAELPHDESAVATELLSTCFAALRRVFKVPPRMPLNERTVRKGALPQYLVINAADYPLQDVAQVVNTLHASFAWLVVVVLVPPDGGLGRDELGRLDLTRAVSVELSPEQEQRAYQLKCSLESVVEPA